MLRDGRADRRHHGAVGAEAGRSPTRRSSCSRPSPTRRSSPSRTSACSRSWSRATATSPRRSSSRRRPARSCASSPARRPTSSRSSTPSPAARRALCAARVRARSSGSTASCFTWPRITACPSSGVEAVRKRLSEAPGRRKRRGAVDLEPPASSTSRTSHADPDYTHGELRGRRGVPEHLAVPMLRDGLSVGAITVARVACRTVLRPADRSPQDLRRPGGHRHRERPAVPGAGGADRAT